jgi:hypothetical protein
MQWGGRHGSIAAANIVLEPRPALGTATFSPNDWLNFYCVELL